jgi:GntR family transcriptional regulator
MLAMVKRVATATDKIPSVTEIPLYEQVADQLRTAIEHGDLQPGQKLPPERDLVEQYGVSRTTITLALNALKAEGLLSSGQGRGTFVRERPLIQVLASTEDTAARRRETDLATFNAEIEATGRTPRQDVIEVATRTAPVDIAKRLHLGEGEQALVRRRLRYVDEVPVARADSYFPLDLVQGTPIANEPHHIPRGVLQILNDLGHPVARFTDEISFRMPSPSETRLLRLSTGVPVVRIIRTAIGSDDKPLEVLDQLLAGDKHVLIYDVPAY